MSVVETGFDLAVIDQLQSLAVAVAKTEFVPNNLRNKPEAILACFVTGQEIGISPMQSLRQIDVIEGRPSLRSELMRALVFKHGYSIWFGTGNEFTNTRVVAYGKRGPDAEVMRVEWTIDQARTAGLANRGPWRSHPRAMLTARATSELCRLIFPDCVAGMGFVPEELVEVSNAHDVSSTMEEIIEAESLPQESPLSLPSPDTAEAPHPQAIEPPESQQLPDEQTKAEKERSKNVVRLAKALGVDHHPVVAIVSRGKKSSASRLTRAEGDEAIKLIHAIADGEVDISTGEVLSTRQQTNSTPQRSNGNSNGHHDFSDRENPDPETWDSIRWRAYLGEHGVSIVEVLREAASLHDNDPPIGTLQSIKGSGMAHELKAYVDSRAGQQQSE